MAYPTIIRSLTIIYYRIRSFTIVYDHILSYSIVYTTAMFANLLDILSMIVYDHILSYTVICYRIWSYIIVYDHILSYTVINYRLRSYTIVLYCLHNSDVWQFVKHCYVAYPTIYTITYDDKWSCTIVYYHILQSSPDLPCPDLPCLPIYRASFLSPKIFAIFTKNWKFNVCFLLKIVNNLKVVVLCPLIPCVRALYFR